MGNEDEQRRREHAARQFWDVLAVTTEHQDINRSRLSGRCARPRSRSTTAPRTSMWLTGRARRYASSTSASRKAFLRGGLARGVWDPASEEPQRREGRDGDRTTIASTTSQGTRI
jgi:hypothetical protein